ncbi:hypothetical protein CC86DRAFT_373740 [Ophiobolus disseminans]|uniref:F-box domain-containing protein n=1 Tax=Ophiobolus disseminans TaxID=1469910 RepID=A0A6A6ZM42_9PLEO|nr:hypothetical protein CC86DRAFT_373740 [Ophiobolus disseminans]
MSLPYGRSRLLHAIAQRWSQATVWFARLQDFTIQHLYLTAEKGTTLDSRKRLISREPTMESTPPSLQSIPPELILELSDFLSRDCILALKLGTRRLNQILSMPPRPQHEQSECERLLILSLLLRDSSRRRCFRCKKIYDAKFFTSRSAPDEVPASLVDDAQRTEYVPYPKGLCHREVGSIMKKIYTGPGGRSGWTSQKDVWCMCCGAVQGWKECKCKCNICPHRSVRTYTQYIDKKAPWGRRQ